MFCKNCGQKIEDGAAVCPVCGAAAEGRSARGPELEEPRRKKSWVLPAVIGGAAVLCIAAAILFSGIFSGARGDLTRAVAKSISTWQAAADTLELPDLAALRKGQKSGQRATVQLKNLSSDFGAAAKMLEGLSITMAGGADLPGRKLNFSLEAAYGPAELFSAQIWGEDSVLTMACPALLGEQTYGFDTETLGQDLARLDPGSAEDVENISFNVFDIAEAFSKPMEIDASATGALIDAMDVEKKGTASVDLDGTPMRSEWYHVTIPHQAMLDYLDAVRAAYDAQEKNRAILDLWRAFGASEEKLAEVEADLRSADMFDGLEDILMDAGDLELDVYLYDGYVAAVIWEDEEKFLHACFGGGENYADDFSLEIQSGDDHIVFSSSGNHRASGGAFTDTSTLAIDGGGLYLPQVSSQLTYDPRQSSDNFSWVLSCEGISLTARGQLTCGSDNLFLDLDQLSFSVLGVEYARLGLSWSAGPYDFSENSLGTPTMLADMTAAGLSELRYEASVNAQNWFLGLMNDAPELFQLFM